MADDLMERAKAALGELKFTDYLEACDCEEKCAHDTHNAGIFRLHQMAPDLARALIRERKAAEALAEAAQATIDDDCDVSLVDALDTYRKATKETDDDK